MALWSLKGKHILVVDDFPEMRSLLRNILLGYGADHITPAANGEDAIDLLCNKSFDVVLCDYNLGDGKDGQQVLEEAKIRGRLPYSAIFIMVTAETSAFMVMGALEYQPDEYLSKPVNKTVLQSRLRKVMEKKEGLKDLSAALQKKDNAAAIVLCDQHITQGAHNRNELLKLKTDLLIEEKNLDAARQVCLEALRERELQWASFALGKIYFLSGEYGQAKTQLEAVINANEAFVAAYDWLARVHQQQGEYKESQAVLERAVAWSAKSVTRLRSLAEVSERNNDLETAEAIRKKAIKVGKNSVLRESGDFTRLASVQMQQGKSKEALRAVDLLKHEFKDSTDARLAAALVETKIHSAGGNPQAAKKAADMAVSLYISEPNVVTPENAVVLTEVCLAHDNADSAKAVVEQLVRNNHDDQDLLARVGDVYRQAGHDHEVDDLMASARKAMMTTNNSGVRLLADGKLDEAIALFEKALELGPNNQVFNVNAAQAYLMSIKNHGPNELFMKKARACLDAVRDSEKLADRYRALNKVYQEQFYAWTGGRRSA